jgi:HEAT repeat protein
MSPPPDFLNKTIDELLMMQDSTNADTRENATTAIAWHLGQDKASDEKAATNDASLVATIALKAFELLKTDKILQVRLASINLLGQLDYDDWTNTIEMIGYALADKNSLVQIRAIDWLNMTTHKHHEKMPSEAINTLLECLKATADPETLWQAALVAGQIGKDAAPTIPILEKLLHHPNKKVREYAIEALQKLRTT